MGKKKKEKKSSKSIKAKSSKKKILQEISEEKFLQDKSLKEKSMKKKSSKEKSSIEDRSPGKSILEPSPKESTLDEEALLDNAAFSDKAKLSHDAVWKEGDIPALFQALSDENRLKILNLLSEQEMCSAELLQSVAVAQSTMSHHMKVLNECGLVSCRRDGKRICYTIRRDTLEQLESMIRHWKGIKQGGSQTDESV
ncbi:MAG: metalloregulator ArsR/SmtB family transcription factor [Lachnospiraceae bacterium]|nr:metalloregulator ArsR/SmtB family transcription factor [Lachnospiraceae bacterium]